jgi:two-component system sensor histidine kinase KdpD
VAIFLPENGRLKVLASSPDYHPDANELGVATWAFEHDQAAGLGTDTLPAASLRCQPLKTAHGLVGVLGVRPKEPGSLLTPEQRQTFDAFAHQAALAVERANLAEQARQAELLHVTEKLQTALLDSISHDLRTPLVSITGALSSLSGDGGTLDEASRQSLIETASEEADRLNRLVGNLLDMTRLEGGALQVRREPCDIQDLIGAALEELNPRLAGRTVTVDLPADLPALPADFVLIGRVLVNVIDNALKYSEADTPIEISAHPAGAFVEITVADRGIGIPAEDLNRIFDKFYRVRRPDNVSGTGLGLAISKGIVEAHGGFISAENRAGGGTVITIGLPLEGSR